MTKAQVARFIVFLKSSRRHEFTCMFFTFSSNSIQTSILKYQKSHRKSYFTMNDLFEIFAEKSNNKSTNIIQKEMFSSRSSEFRRIRINFLTSVNQSDLKNSNTIILHRFHFIVYSELTHDHKFSTTFVLSILSFKSMRQLNIVSFTSTFTFKSTSTTTKFSQHSISMQKTSMICSFTSSSNSFRISILSYIASKIYMIIKKLFEMFVEKTRRKNKSIIQKKSTFSCFFEFSQFR